MLIEKCYKKHKWFHLVRDPLVWGMKYLAWVNGIEANRQAAKQSYCKGCVRFIKNELEEKSATFKLLNRLIAPRFARLRNSMVTEQDMKAARQRAIEASA
jgi:predicted outer membrane protein